MTQQIATAHADINPALSIKDTKASKREYTGSGLPPAPDGMEDIGLSPSFLLELTLKVIHYADSPTTEHIARVIALPAKLVEALLDALKADKLCEIVGGGSTYDLSTNYRFRLTEKGEQRAEQALERCRYAGAAPVTIAQYQRINASMRDDVWRPSQSAVENAFTKLIIDDSAAALLSKALRSGRCAMVFGPSGNGKTHLLAEFVRHLEGEIVIPHALYAYGQIIRLFDQTVHIRREPAPKQAPEEPPAEQGMKRAAREEIYDRRWIMIQRPGLIVGGELTSESLELGYDPVTKFYQAPKHLKAQGGVLLVDDFGRQRIAPAELLNRWIMALERGTDNLLLRTGESIEVPFDVRLLFSTNLDPADLADAAFLRRIPYKVQMPSTPRETFARILHTECQEKSVVASLDDARTIITYLNERCHYPLSGALARDLAMIIADNAALEERQPVLDEDSVAIAYLQFTGTPPDGYEMPASPRRKGNGASPGSTAASESTANGQAQRDTGPSLAELAARINESSEDEDAEG